EEQGRIRQRGRPCLSALQAVPKGPEEPEAGVRHADNCASTSWRFIDLKRRKSVDWSFRMPMDILYELREHVPSGILQLPSTVGRHRRGATPDPIGQLSGQILVLAGRMYPRELDQGAMLAMFAEVLCGRFRLHAHGRIEELEEPHPLQIAHRSACALLKHEPDPFGRVSGLVDERK